MSLQGKSTMWLKPTAFAYLTAKMPHVLSHRMQSCHLPPPVFGGQDQCHVSSIARISILSPQYEDVSKYSENQHVQNIWIHPRTSIHPHKVPFVVSQPRDSTSCPVMPHPVTPKVRNPKIQRQDLGPSWGNRSTSIRFLISQPPILRSNFNTFCKSSWAIESRMLLPGGYSFFLVNNNSF